MPMIDAILGELEREAGSTRKLLERVPVDKFDWSPHPKSMNLGRLATHLAILPANISRMASLDTFEFGGFAFPEIHNREELLARLDQSLGQAREILGGMTDERLMSDWSGTREGKTLMTIPRILLLRAVLLNHWYHHRGQLTVYLRLLEIPLPSIYGPSADENPFAA